MKVRYFCSLIACLSGCSEGAYKMGSEADEYVENLNAISQLRIDVHPSNNGNALLSQSFAIDESYTSLTDLNFQMKPTVQFNGYVTGYSVFPHSSSDVSVPGQAIEVETQLELSELNSINGGIFSTDTNGYFQIEVPESDNYSLAATPINQTEIPYRLIEGLSLEQTDYMDIELGFGQPVYGTITGLENYEGDAYVQIVDAASGLKGTKSYLHDGQFLLRAPLDRNDFVLTIQGESTQLIPTIEVPFRIESEESDGYSMEMDIGSIHPVFVEGQLTLPDESPYEDRAEIRFISQELYDIEGSLTIETNNDTQGNFTTRLLPGKWRAEFIPPFGTEQTIAPTDYEFSIDSTSQIDLGSISLRSKVRVFGQVLDPDGLPASDVTVSLQEANYKNYIYNATTDADGRIEMQVPPVSFFTTLTPLDDSAAITNFVIPAPEDDQEIQWTMQYGTPMNGNIVFENEAVGYALIEIWKDSQVIGSSLTDMDGNFNLRVQIDE